MVVAVIGVGALWLMYGWLACGIAASYLSERKGYGVRVGLAAGLLLAPIGVIILLVEQNANFALSVSNRAYVLETGKVALSDDSDKLRENPQVQEAYLGA